MSFKQCAYLLLFALAALNVSAQKVKKLPNKPNIIYILADDLGIANVSCYGADQFKTPEIDKLAQNGIRFDNAYTAPLCGPSRALIMTGRYPFRTGAMNQDQTGLMKPTEEIMMPSTLKPAGYVTSCVGKWGQLPLGPAEFGFDDFIRFKGSGVYWNDKSKGEEYVENGETKILKDDEYMPDLMHNHLVNFLAKNKDKPFYVYYPMSHIHAKIVRTPDSKPGSDLYTDNINYMDKLVGKLMKVLDSLKLRDNTLIFFMGDNGEAGGHALTSTINGGKHLVGKKGTMQECGSLVPLIANWPGVIAPSQTTKSIIDATDFFPTLTEIAGGKLPVNTIIDGRSFAQQLIGKKEPKRDWMFMELGKTWYVRESKWKLNRENELFDMSKTPYEEILVPTDTKDKEAIAARIRIQGILDKLNPAGGKLDEGDGSGRHANKVKNEKGEKVKKNKNKEKEEE